MLYINVPYAVFTYRNQCPRCSSVQCINCIQYRYYSLVPCISHTIQMCIVFVYNYIPTGAVKLKLIDDDILHIEAVHVCNSI